MPVFKRDTRYCTSADAFDIYRSLITREIIVLFPNRRIHYRSSQYASMIVNERTDPSTCHCLLDTCHPDFLLSIADGRSDARVRISPGKDLSCPSIVCNGLNDLDFILGLEPQTTNNRSRANPRAARRRTSAHYSRRIERACERS